MVALDMSVDLFLVIAVVTEGIKDLCQREVWQPARNFLRGNAKSPELDNGADRGTCAPNNRFIAKNLVTQSQYRHELLFAAWLFPPNSLCLVRCCCNLKRMTVEAAFSSVRLETKMPPR